MTKGILKYDLNDPDEDLAFKRAVNSLDAFLCLWTIKDKLHYHYKHKELTDEQSKMLEEMQELIYEVLAQYNLNPDEYIR